MPSSQTYLNYIAYPTLFYTKLSEWRTYVNAIGISASKIQDDARQLTFTYEETKTRLNRLADARLTDSL